MSSWVGEEFAAMGYEVVVANSAKVPLSGSNQQKNDQTDAYLLAKLGRADVELLSPVRPLGTAGHRCAPGAEHGTVTADGDRRRGLVAVECSVRSAGDPAGW